MEAPPCTVIVVGIVLNIHIAAGLTIKTAWFLSILTLHCVNAAFKPGYYLLIFRF